MEENLMLVIGAVCIISVFVNGMMLSISLKKHEEMLKLYQGAFNLVKQSKLRRRR